MQFLDEILEVGSLKYVKGLPYFFSFYLEIVRFGIGWFDVGAVNESLIQIQNYIESALLVVCASLFLEVLQ